MRYLIGLIAVLITAYFLGFASGRVTKGCPPCPPENAYVAELCYTIVGPLAGGMWIHKGYLDNEELWYSEEEVQAEMDRQQEEPLEDFTPEEEELEEEFLEAPVET